MKSVVLLSSGLDSTVNLYQAAQDGKVLLALTFDYGQRAGEKEVASAQKITSKLGVPHKVLKLPFFSEFGQSSLLDRSKQVPSGSQVSIDDLSASQKTAKSVWVPNRNGIFLNIAAGFAESLGADAVIPGFNIEEAATFPDNTDAFLQALTKSFSFSTGNQLKAFCHTTKLNKTEIVKLGESLQVDWSQIWPCYHSEEKWCGQCESCLRAQRAFSTAQVSVKHLFKVGDLKC
jgi:7-cyano-7-deazaguanine synthase